jgi:hypothetical protein
MKIKIADLVHDDTDFVHMVEAHFGKWLKIDYDTLLECDEKVGNCNRVIDCLPNLTQEKREQLSAAGHEFWRRLWPIFDGVQGVSTASALATLAVVQVIYPHLKEEPDGCK